MLTCTLYVISTEKKGVCNIVYGNSDSCATISLSTLYSNVT